MSTSSKTPTLSRGSVAQDVIVPFAELKIGAELGKGEFGRVCRGTFKGKDVAIKLVNVGVQEQQLKREIQLHRAAKHDYIVEMIGLSKETGPKGCLILVLEFMGGGQLLEHLKSKAEIAWPTRLAYASQICGAMTFLQSNNIMHRDLKSENMLLDTAKSVAKLSDFGFSKLVERRSRTSTVVRSGPLAKKTKTIKLTIIASLEPPFTVRQRFC